MASGTPASGSPAEEESDLACSAQLPQGADVGLAVPEDMHGQPLPRKRGKHQRPEVPAGSGPRGAVAASDKPASRGRECQLQTGLATPGVIGAGTGRRPAVIPACVSARWQRRGTAPPRWPGCARGR